MKMYKRIKKGFTLVELVVVIAVIAVLAAVSVISYTTITKRAKESNDHLLIDQINTSLRASSILSKKHTLHDVLVDLKEDNGFGVEKLKPELKDAEFVYSYSMDKFAYYKDDKVVYPEDVAKNPRATGLDLWFFKDVQSNSANATLEAGKSFYVKSIPSTVTTLNVKGGVDLGSQFVENVVYTNETSTAQSVVIRTNTVATTLTINAPLDTVDHYDNVGKVDAQKVDLNHCYNEYGNAGYVKLTEGKVVAKNGGKIGVVFAANNDKNAVSVLKETGAQIEQAYTVIQEVSDTNAARTNGIALDYAVTDAEASSMTESAKATALVEQSSVVEVEAAEAIDELAGKEVASDPNIENYAARIGTKGYASFTEAYNASISGNTIVLLKNVVLGDVIEGNFFQEDLTTGFDFDKGGLSLDLNGYSLVSNVNVTYGFYITPDADLTIKDSSGGGMIRAPRSEQVIKCLGTIYFYGGTILSEYAGGQYGAEALSVDGTAYIYGGTISAEAEFVYQGYEELGPIYNFSINNRATTYIYGGTFKCSVKDNNYNGIGNCGSLYIMDNITTEGLYWVNNGNSPTKVEVATGKTLSVDGFYAYNQYKKSSGGKTMTQTGNISYDSEACEIWVEE